MSEFPSKARVVVIGAGIVGNAVVGHLAELGWTSIVQIDKGPLPNPGGSTGHASNFIFPVDHNKEMTALTLDSQAQYEEMGVSTTCGGIEVARTEERMEELRRRMSSATAFGIESSLLSPSEVKELVPFLDESVIVGGFYTPSVSVVDSLQAGTIFRERAQAKAALEVFANTEVTDIETSDGAVSAVVTDRGRIEAEYVVVACGVWSPRLASMAGATIPLTPAVHQMIDVGPIDVLVETNNEIGYPIVRDMDTFMYERQTAGSIEVGSYAHRPIFHRPDDIPSIQESKLSPTEMPFTPEDFDAQLEDALELMPDILSTAEMKYGINGLLSLTPDAMPVIGETVEVRNLWSAAAVWIKEGPGMGRLIAEWMTFGGAWIDPHSSDIARLYPWARTVEHVEARCAEHFNKTYGIVHPREQWESERNLEVSPLADRTGALGAVNFQAGGHERPQWYTSNAHLVEKYGVEDRPHEWDARWWSPIITAEHLALRENVGIVDLSAFVTFDVTGPGALDYVQSMVVNQVDKPVGSAIYTPVLDSHGGFRSDLTVKRLGANHFRIVTGAFDGPRDEYWFRKHLPQDESVTFENTSAETVTIGVWGPKAREVLQTITSNDLSNDGFPYGTTAEIDFGGITARLLRISYVGDLGWEIYVKVDEAVAVWDKIWDAGQPHGMVPVGAGVYGTTGRLEKGYRLMGAELESEYTPVEAGLDRPRVKAADFVGKEAYLKARDEGPAAIACTFSVDDHMSEAGIPRYMCGGEPIVDLDGNRILDSKGRISLVTTAGNGPSAGKYLLMGYLPADVAVEGAKLGVKYMNEVFPITVVRAGSTPLFDPEDARMKA